MTIHLQDSFARTGALLASAPNTVAAFGAVWAGSGNLTCASGKVNVTTAMSTGYIECDTSTTLAEVQLTTSLTTGTALSFPTGVVASAIVDIGRYTYGISISTPDLGATYSLTITTGSGYSGPDLVSHGPYTVSLATSTTYQIKITTSGTAQLIEAFGQAVSTTEVYTDTAAPTTVTIGSSPTISIGPVYLGTPIVLESITGSASLTSPAPTLRSASGARVLISPLAPTLLITGHYAYGERAAFLAAPSPALKITTGGNAGLMAPKPTLVAVATGTNWANAELNPPAAILSTTGTVTELATVDLSAPSQNLIGYSGAVCSITLTGKSSVQSTGTTGGIASIAVACPLFELTSSGTAQNHGYAHLLSPSPNLGSQAQAWLMPPAARLTAIGTATITATYEAYAVNLKHAPRGSEQPVDEVTRYTNFPFTHVVRYQNSYYGVNSTGMYLLEGTTDDTAPIPFAVKTAMTDFKSPAKKTLASAYFGGRFGPASTVQLHAGEEAPNTYSYSTPRDALAQNHRQVFGKGVKERYLALGVSGAGTLELDSIELDVHNISRRI